MEFLLFMVIFGVVTGVVAHSRGREPVLWGILGALMFIIALPVLLCIPPIGRKCPHCAEFVKDEATVCKHCHKALA